MSYILASILGFVQAVTEFLPISSSGHLVMFQVYLEPAFGGGKTPLAFDILLHLATFLVTVFYLRTDLIQVLVAFFANTELGRRARRLTFLVVIASLPIVVVGLGLRQIIHQLFSSVEAAANGFFVTTIVLVAANWKQKIVDKCREKDRVSQTWQGGGDWELPSPRQALIIGVAQAVALLPGISRSGSTIGVALLLGSRTETAIRFSFLLSLPAILGACLLELGSLGELTLADSGAYAVGCAVTFASGLLAIRALVKITHGRRLVFFAVYTFVLALALHLEKLF